MEEEVRLRVECRGCDAVGEWWGALEIEQELDGKLVVSTSGCPEGWQPPSWINFRTGYRCPNCKEGS